MANLIVCKTVTDGLCADIHAGYPFETCGALLGDHGQDLTHVKAFRACKNLNTQRAEDRFLLDPDDFLRADQDAQQLGLDIVGIWHSHPDHPAVPSATDLQAAWPGWSYLIASVNQQGVEDIRSWRLNGQRFVEEEINNDNFDANSDTP